MKTSIHTKIWGTAVFVFVVSVAVLLGVIMYERYIGKQKDDGGKTSVNLKSLINRGF